MGMVERLKSWCNSHHHRQTPTLFWKQITQFGVKCFRVWCHHLITLQFRVRRKACANSALVPIAPHESAKTAKGWMRKQRGWSETVGICRCECLSMSRIFTSRMFGRTILTHEGMGESAGPVDDAQRSSSRGGCERGLHWQERQKRRRRRREEKFSFVFVFLVSWLCWVSYLLLISLRAHTQCTAFVARRRGDWKMRGNCLRFLCFEIFVDRRREQKGGGGGRERWS